MWPEMGQDELFTRLDNIRDLIRIAFNAEGENKARLLETARSMIEELGRKVEEQQEDEEDD